MGLFDFLKKNKNIINDNGLNKIYYDNGKGSIKEKFSKINGELNGEYIEYDRNGTFNIKTYKDGAIPLTEEEILFKNREEEINKNIKVEISKLIIIDDLISEISGIFLLVQMENSKINYYTKLIEKKFNKQFDEEYIKFYLYTKRNYFIKNLIQFGESKDLNICFTEHIKNYQKNRLYTNKLRWEYWHYNITDDIIDKILEVNIKGEKLKCEISISGNGINKDIFIQESIIFGLNHKDYTLIHEILLKYEKLKQKQERDADWENRKKSFGPVNENWDEMFKPKKLNEPIEDKVIIKRAVNEIKLLCSNNKVIQEDIILILN